jgi:hypothetical protein
MIYRQILAADFDRLPAMLRVFHSAPGGGHAVGTASVIHQNKWLARLLRFPRAGPDQPLRLDVVAKESEETWTRSFGNSQRRSVQTVRAGLLVEDLGPMQIEFRVISNSNGMRFCSQRARLLGIPVPVHVEAHVKGNNRGWDFEVTVERVGSYKGSINQVTTSQVTK